MKAFCLAVFAEGSFEDLYWFDTELEVDTFAEGLSAGAGYYSGSCEGYVWPLNAHTESIFMDVPARSHDDRRSEMARADRAYEKAKAEAPGDGDAR